MVDVNHEDGLLFLLLSLRACSRGFGAFSRGTGVAHGPRGTQTDTHTERHLQSHSTMNTTTTATVNSTTYYQYLVYIIPGARFMIFRAAVALFFL